jgi:hypothetical protein
MVFLSLRALCEYNEEAETRRNHRCHSNLQQRSNLKTTKPIMTTYARCSSHGACQYASDACGSPQPQQQFVHLIVSSCLQ